MCETGMMIIALLPSIGRSKAACIRKQGEADVFGSNIDEWAWLDDVGKMSDDFFADGRQQPEQQVRPELDKLFD